MAKALNTIKILEHIEMLFTGKSKVTLVSPYIQISDSL